MLNEPSNQNNKNPHLKTTNIVKDNINCKDGFCSLQNQKEISKQNENETNLFDPIQ